MQTSVRVRVLSSVVVAVGCAGFEARNYDAPVPPHGAAGMAGYSYTAEPGTAGAAANPPTPREQSGDWGPSKAGDGATGEGGARGDEPHAPVTHADHGSGGAPSGAGTGASSDTGGEGGEDSRRSDGGVSGGGAAPASGTGQGGSGAGASGAPGGAGEASSTGGRGSAGRAGSGGRSGAGLGGASGSSNGGSGETGSGGQLAAGGASGSAGTPPAVIFSEYVEGSSRYKALELRALAPSVLDGCRIATYSNGGTTPRSLALSGALAEGATLVVCSAELAELVGPTCTLSASLSFNGNDALVLECGDAALDAIGQIGVDPGEAWTSGDASTANQTLRRRCSVTHGDSTATDVFEPGREWAPLPTDDFSGLGAPDCG